MGRSAFFYDASDAWRLRLHGFTAEGAHDDGMISSRGSAAWLAALGVSCTRASVRVDFGAPCDAATRRVAHGGPVSDGTRMDTTRTSRVLA